MTKRRRSYQKPFVRIAIDAAMTVILFILMAHVLIGGLLHEVLGICMFALLILHHALNRSWYSTAAFRGGGFERALRSVVNALLLLAIIGAAVSSVLVSRDVFAFVGLHGGLFARKLHACATAWCFVLMSIHIGLHWNALSGVAPRLTRPMPGKARGAGRFRKTAAFAAGIIVYAYGVYASFVHELGAKLVMYYGYSFWDPARPKFFFVIDMIAIMGLYICAARCAISLMRTLAKRQSEVGKERS